MRNTHLPDAFTALFIGITLALLLLIVSMLVTGCVSMTVLDAGGRDTSLHFYGYKSSNNDLRSSPEIAGGGSVQDAFKDLLKGLPLDGEGLAAILKNVGDTAANPPRPPSDPDLSPIVAPARGPSAAPDPVPTDWISTPREIDLPSGDWFAQYEVRGLVPNPGHPEGRSDCEHLFGDLRGAGFERVLLANMCNDDQPRQLRVIVEDADGKREFNLDRPADGFASVAWEFITGRIAISINGRQWIDEPLTGNPETLVVGGGNPRDRSFAGQWRNLETIPPQRGGQ